MKSGNLVLCQCPLFMECLCNCFPPSAVVGVAELCNKMDGERHMLHVS